MQAAIVYQGRSNQWHASRNKLRAFGLTKKAAREALLLLEQMEIEHIGKDDPDTVTTYHGAECQQVFERVARFHAWSVEETVKAFVDLPIGQHMQTHFSYYTRTK